MNGTSYDFSTTGLEVVGKGSRRICYRMGDTGLCAKFYRAQADLSQRAGLRFRFSMQVARFCRWMNVNYQEWRYYQTLRQRLPSELLAVFPESIEPVYSPQHGWGVIESLIVNADGTSVQLLVTEMERISDPEMRMRILKATALFFEQLECHAVCFFDPLNTLLQWTGPGRFRLRIADFEPQCRALIPGLSHVKPYVRSKVRRRCGRFLNQVRATHLPEYKQPEAASFARQPKRRWLPAAASF